LENKISNLKQELTGLLCNFNNENNRYSNPKFFKSIGFVGLIGIAVATGSRFIGTVVAAVGAVAGSSIKYKDAPSTAVGGVLGSLKKELERRQKNEKFNVYLKRIIAENDFSNSDVRERANMDKGYFYKILSGEKKPGKDMIIQIAIALNLNIEDTNKLLGMLGYVLYGENPRDFIILFCIENKLDLMNVNYMLDELKEKPLATAS
jgi:transcriptional regulator with XRE-family HTH domain